MLPVTGGNTKQITECIRCPNRGRSLRNSKIKTHFVLRVITLLTCESQRNFGAHRPNILDVIDERIIERNSEDWRKEMPRINSEKLVLLLTTKDQAITIVAKQTGLCNSCLTEDQTVNSENTCPISRESLKHTISNYINYCLLSSRSRRSPDSHINCVRVRNELS